MNTGLRANGRAMAALSSGRAATLLARNFMVSVNGTAQLLPAGKFAARDGRPGPGKSWEITDSQGIKLAGEVNSVAARTPIVIDFEHQTLRAEKNGLPAPAAGWIVSVEWRAGEGLFAKVDWTAEAKALIGANKYRYISPVIAFAPDGTVTGVLLAALVNHPALLGMEPVSALLATAGAATGGLSDEQIRMAEIMGISPDALAKHLRRDADALSGQAWSGLSGEQLRIAAAMGIDPEKFAAHIWAT